MNKLWDALTDDVPATLLALMLVLAAIGLYTDLLFLLVLALIVGLVAVFAQVIAAL